MKRLRCVVNKTYTSQFFSLLSVVFRLKNVQIHAKVILAVLEIIKK